MSVLGPAGNHPASPRPVSVGSDGTDQVKGARSNALMVKGNEALSKEHIDELVAPVVPGGSSNVEIADTSKPEMLEVRQSQISEISDRISKIDLALRTIDEVKPEANGDALVMLLTQRSKLLEARAAFQGAKNHLKTSDAISSAIEKSKESPAAEAINEHFKTARASAGDAGKEPIGDAQLTSAHATALRGLAQRQLVEKKSWEASRTFKAAEDVLTKGLTRTGEQPELAARLIHDRLAIDLVAAEAPMFSMEMQSFREQNAAKTFDAENPLPPVAQQAVADSKAKINHAHARAKEELSTQIRSIESKLAATKVRPEKTDLSQALDALNARRDALDISEKARMAGVYASVNDVAGQKSALEDELKAIVGDRLEIPFEPNTIRRISADGREATGLSSFAAHEVGSISDTLIGRFKDQFSALSGEQQQQALATLSRYSATLSENGTPTEANVARQLLAAGAVASGDITKQLQAQLADAQLQLKVGNPQVAEEAYRAVERAAAQLPDEKVGLALGKQAVLGRVKSLSGAVDAANPADKSRAADEIRYLREDLEKESPRRLDSADLSRVVLAEMDAYNKADESKSVVKSLNHLKEKYSNLTDENGQAQVPWLGAALKGFEAQNSDSKAVAFAQVMLSQLNSSTGTEIAGVAGLTVAGAALGFGVGGVAGAIPGALFGAAAGSTGLLARNFDRGIDNALAAAETGINRQTAFDTALDAVGVAADLFAPLGLAKGAKTIGGTAGVKAMFGSGLGDDAAAVLDGGLIQLEKQIGSEAWKVLPQQEQVQAAQTLLAKKFSDAVLSMGGKGMQVAGIGGMTAAFGSQLAEIQMSDQSPAQKAAAREKLYGEMGKALGMMAITMGPMAAIQKAAMSGLAPQLRDAVRNASQNSMTKIVGDDEYQKALKNEAESEIKSRNLGDDEAATVRAHYDEIGRKNEAYFDTASGTTYVSRSAATDADGLQKMLRHERAHREFHSMNPKKRDELVRAFESLPENEKLQLQKQVKDANPHATGFTTQQIVDEYQAMRRVEGSSAGLSTSFDKALARAGLKDVKEVDVEQLVKTGKLDDGSSFIKTSRDRLAMGNSEAKDRFRDLRDRTIEWPALELVKNGEMKVSNKQTNAPLRTPLAEGEAPAIKTQRQSVQDLYSSGRELGLQIKNTFGFFAGDHVAKFAERNGAKPFTPDSLNQLSSALGHDIELAKANLAQRPERQVLLRAMEELKRDLDETVRAFRESEWISVEQGRSGLYWP